MFEYVATTWIIWGVLAVMGLFICIDLHKENSTSTSAKELRTATVILAATPFAPILTPFAIIVGAGLMLFQLGKMLLKKISWMTSTIANAWRFDEVSN